MCGIIGVINTKRAKTDIRNIIENKLDAIKHRGPDAQGIFIQNQYGIGHCRLSINDPTPAGDQPFIFQNIVLVCNGEIYNHEDLKSDCADYNFKSNSDNEVIIPLYLKYGERLLDMLDGEFAFLLIDLGKNKIIAARDPMGVKQLYQCKTDDGEIWFSSEDHILEDLSNDIRPISPGCYWTVTNPESRYYVRKWWDFSGPTSHGNNKVDYKELRELIIRSVRKRLMSDKPIGCMLSGGLDSSIITAIAAKYHSEKIRTYSVGLSDSIDLPYARQVADYLGTSHHEIIITENDVMSGFKELFRLGLRGGVLYGASPLYILYKYASQFNPVLLVGEGSDEIFNGYALPSENIFSDEFIHDTNCYQISILSTGLLRRADIASMANGVEIRVPFLDKEVVDYVMQLDPKLKAVSKCKIEKYILRKSFNGFLPNEILWRKKLATAKGYSGDFLKKFRAATSRYKHAYDKNDDAPPIHNYYNIRSDSILIPKLFFGCELYEKYRSAGAKEILLDTDNETKKNISHILESYIYDKNNIKLDLISGILDHIGVKVPCDMRGAKISFSEIVNNSKLISLSLRYEM